MVGICVRFEHSQNSHSCTMSSRWPVSSGEVVVVVAVAVAALVNSLEAFGDSYLQLLREFRCRCVPCEHG